MNRLIWICLAAMLLGGLPSAGIAGDFDGSRPMICATIQAIECTQRNGCSNIALEEAGVPRFAVIDVSQKAIHPTQESGIDRSSAIERTTTVDGKLILQGAEDGVEGIRDGLGWTIAVTEDSGDFVLTASGHDVAFVVFGACTIHR